MLLLCVVMLLGLAANAHAADEGLKVHNATAKKGETVYLTVELTESVVGNALSVEYSFDSKHLKALPKSCSWARTGALQDFSKTGNKGVWTTDTATDLKGGICVLAFEVKTLAFFQSTEVSCTVVIKNSGQKSQSFTATGKIIMDCEHSYGQWIDGGLLGHYQICEKCDGKLSQSHQWDAGVVVESKKNPGMLERHYTCQVCGGPRVVQEGPAPIDPTEEKQPSTLKPETTATNPGQDPVKPTVPENQDPQIQQTNPMVGSTDQGHGHNQTPIETFPEDDIQPDHTHPHEQIQTQPQQTVDPHAGQDHGDTQSDDGQEASKLAVGLAVLLALAVLTIVIVLIVKRKN